MTLPSAADQIIVIGKGKMALDQWLLCRLIWQMRILKLVHSPKYLMKNELQMFASTFPCKVHICICSIMHKQSYISLFTLWPRSLMDMHLMVCGDVNTHSDNKQVLLLLHAEVSLNAQRPIFSILSMLFGHKRPRGCASAQAQACNDADGGD